MNNFYVESQDDGSIYEYTVRVFVAGWQSDHMNSVERPAINEVAIHTLDAAASTQKARGLLRIRSVH